MRKDIEGDPCPPQSDLECQIAATGGSEYRVHMAWTVLALAIAYGYIGIVVDVPQFYHARQRPFVMDWQFLKTFLDYPGGPTDALGAFLVQFYAYPWTGALVLTIIFAGIFFVTKTVLVSFGTSRGNLLAIVPGVFAFILVCRNMTIVPICTILLAILFFRLYIRLRPVNGILQFLTISALSVLVYYVAAGGVLLFVILCTLDLLRARKWLAAAASFSTGVALPYLFRWLIYEPDLLALYLRNAPIESRWQIYEPHLLGLYLRIAPVGEGIAAIGTVSLLLYIALWLYVPVATMFVAAGPPRWGVNIWGRLKAGSSRWRTAARVSFVLLIACALAAPVAMKSHHRDWTVADRMIDHGRWDEALAIIPTLPVQSPLVSHLANRALFHVGHLSGEMFNYPQYENAGVLLLDGEQFDSIPRVDNKRSNIYFDLGMLNRSERWAQEAATIQGEMPLIMKRLAIINLAKARPGAATDFIATLRKTPFQRRWARDMEQKLKDDKSSEHNTKVQSLRAKMLKKDYIGEWTPEERFKQCLAANPKNKMAFEYLMAQYLITRHPEKLVAELARLDDFDYTGIPRHYEEAILFYMKATGAVPAELDGRRIRPETCNRFKEFLKIYTENHDDMNKARKALAPQFGDTYWFFHVFGRSAAAYFAGEEGLCP